MNLRAIEIVYKMQYVWCLSLFVASQRGRADQPAFQMPLRFGKKQNWQVLRATRDWPTTRTTLTVGEREVRPNLYYGNVTRQQVSSEDRNREFPITVYSCRYQHEKVFGRFFAFDDPVLAGSGAR
jgi:hypothetical protein